MFSEAHILMNSGRLNRALEVLDAIGQVEPFSEDIHLHKASIYSQLRNHRRSVEHYKRALELADEGLDDIHLDLAFEYENLEEFDEALGCLKKALDMNPENEAVLYEMAYCFDLADAVEASVVAFLASSPTRTPILRVAWYNLGNALARLERLEESIEAWTCWPSRIISPALTSARPGTCCFWAVSRRPSTATRRRSTSTAPKRSPSATSVSVTRRWSATTMPC
ncbi:MAG: tetratricopeptide repeat protein [Flavobacteriales bacterium]|nr:tetratricopeptide repeat protein [Flavobacteriales bacterium]